MSEVRNPYAPPTAQVGDPIVDVSETEALIENGRAVPIENGVRWISAAFQLFFQRPWKWLGVTLLLIVLAIVVSIIPLGTILSSLFWPLVSGGLAMALEAQRQTRNFTLAQVFSGFGPRAGALALVGFTMLLTYPITYVVMTAFVGNEFAIAMLSGGTDFAAMQFSWSDFGYAMLISFALSLPLVFATYLAPPLIVLHGLNAGQAMKMSLIGSLKNILPGLLYCIVLLIVVVVSMIPLLLGLLVTLPVAFIVFYTIYRDIFVGGLSSAAD